MNGPLYAGLIIHSIVISFRELIKIDWDFNFVGNRMGVQFLLFSVIMGANFLPIANCSNEHYLDTWDELLFIDGNDSDINLGFAPQTPLMGFFNDSFQWQLEEFENDMQEIPSHGSYSLETPLQTGILSEGLKNAPHPRRYEEADPEMIEQANPRHSFIEIKHFSAKSANFKEINSKLIPLKHPRLDEINPLDTQQASSVTFCGPQEYQEDNDQRNSSSVGESQSELYNDADSTFNSDKVIVRKPAVRKYRRPKQPKAPLDQKKQSFHFLLPSYFEYRKQLKRDNNKENGHSTEKAFT